MMDNTKRSRSSGEATNVKDTTAASPIPTPTYFAFWSTGSATYPIFSHSLICSVILLLSSTGTLPLIQSFAQPFISTLALFLLRTTFILTAIISFLHQSGALRRYVLKFAEAELSKNLNGALITLSDGQVDLLRGKVIVQDLIIHNKDRDHWEWDSPCLVRVGRVEATLNFASVIQLPKIGRILNHSFFDIYTVLVEDVQVFVEKRKNVFNFHLLDPSLDIDKNVMEEYKEMKGRNLGAADSADENDLRVTKSLSLDREEQRGDLVGVREEGVPIREREDEANKIVEKLVGAVSNIGKAANQGGSKGLQSALRNQKDGLVHNLKKLHTGGKLTRGVSESGSVFDFKSKKEHGVSVMKEMGKIVEKNVNDIKNQVGFLQKPPEKKKGWVTRPPDDIRIASILLREGRIFTKDILVAKGGNGDDAANATHSLVAERSSSRNLKSGNGSSTSSGWAKPIVIFELAITGAELCPPLSARDPQTGMPKVAISMDRLVDIIAKRIMAEIAKSNTGRLFNTAFGDVFSFVHENTRKGN